MDFVEREYRIERAHLLHQRRLFSNIIFSQWRSRQERLMYHTNVWFFTFSTLELHPTVSRYATTYGARVQSHQPAWCDGVWWKPVLCTKSFADSINDEFDELAVAFACRAHIPVLVGDRRIGEACTIFTKYQGEVIEVDTSIMVFNAPIMSDDGLFYILYGDYASRGMVRYLLRQDLRILSPERPPTGWNGHGLALVREEDFDTDPHWPFRRFLASDLLRTATTADFPRGYWPVSVNRGIDTSRPANRLRHTCRPYVHYLAPKREADEQQMRLPAPHGFDAAADQPVPDNFWDAERYPDFAVPV